MIKLVLAALAAAFFVPFTLLDAPVCLPRNELRAHLAVHLQEFLIAESVSRAGIRTEVYATGSGDRWTVAETDAANRSCLKASGAGWGHPPLTPKRGLRFRVASQIQSAQKGHALWIHWNRK
jgi:hypothetical protein